MTRDAWMIVLGLAAAGCEKDPSPPRPKPPKHEGPLPIVFGDCAPITAAFVSGPRPQAFTADDLAHVLVPAPAAPRSAPPPPPVPPGGREQGRMLTGTTPFDSPALAGMVGTNEGGGTIGIFDPATQPFDAPPAGTAGGLGFGRNATGPGGTGADWGAIMHGPGTLGHGYGAGPIVSLATPEVSAGLDPAIVRRYLRRNVTAMRDCYAQALRGKPTLAGTVTARFTISATGAVSQAHADGVDPAVASCIAGVIATIELPMPSTRAPMTVTEKLELRPATAGELTAAPAPEVPQVRSPLALGPARPDASRDYRAGAHNPLQQRIAELTTCLRSGEAAAGVVVIDFQFDPAGNAAVTVTVTGIADDATRTCIAVAATPLSHTADAKPARCSFAYGIATPAAQPVVELDRTTVAFAGKPLADDLTPSQIPALVGAVEAQLAPLVAPTGPALVKTGPIVIAPSDATPVLLVLRALGSVLAAGGDAVLAHRTAAGLELVTPVALPVVPVPFGTGARWMRIRGGPRAAGAPAAAVPNLSVLVGADTIWIGVSPANDFVSIPAGPAQAAALAAALTERKHDAAFAQRTDLEIAGAPTATYGALVAAIAAAQTAGFTDWQLADELHLSAHPTL